MDGGARMLLSGRECVKTNICLGNTHRVTLLLLLTKIGEVRFDRGKTASIALRNLAHGAVRKFLVRHLIRHTL